VRYSLRSRIALMIAVIAVTLSTVSILVSSHTIQRLVDTSYQERAVEISKTVAAVLDAEKALTLKNEIMTIYRSIDNKVGSDAWGTPEFDAYCAQYSGLEQSEEFVNMRQTLRRITAPVRGTATNWIICRSNQRTRFIYCIHRF